MSLTAEQVKQRDGKLTASRVGVLMSGDAAKILALWEEMVGTREPEDLSHIWAVQLGSATEHLQLDWYALKTGHPVTRRGEVVVMPGHPWAASTLDGWDDYYCCPIEAKHVGGFEPRERIIARYMPQCHWQMMCSGALDVSLSIIEGAKEPVVEIIHFDDAYSAELWQRAVAFMECVRDLIPPVALPAVEPPVQAVRTVDMSQSNAWPIFAAQWLENYAPAKRFEEASKELRSMVEPDVAIAHGSGIRAKRNKAGAISITKEA